MFCSSQKLEKSVMLLLSFRLTAVKILLGSIILGFSSEESLI